ncbi:MAG: FeoB-associated Cys-rich membrane protein [Treponema sp.]|nr:FeoB-associated Cys-rich membrane protein [Treponema sp.]
MKPIDFLIIGIIAVLVAFAIVKIIRNKKNGKCNCGCTHCTGCKEKLS